MNRKLFGFAALAASTALLPLFAAAAEPDLTRTIHLTQDDAQVRFVAKVYELKCADAAELLPFVRTAIVRYSKNSTVRRVTSNAPGARGALLVTTGVDFMPYVDQIVAALDRPGRKDPKRSGIEGTGMGKVVYTPNYRAAGQFSDIINRMLGSSAGRAYVNAETNTIFWRDQKQSAFNTLSFVQKLDRPLPQVHLRLNYYELRDSDLKDWGFDYLAWKNGPGVNLLNVGYNAGGIAIDELIGAIPYAASATWGLGGLFTAPQIDMSFIRCLQQSGGASVAANASLTFVSTPVASADSYRQLLNYQTHHASTAPFIYRASMYPEYNNIAKNVLGRTFVGKSFYEDEYGVQHANPPVLEAAIINPFICSGGMADARGFLPRLTAKDRLVLERSGGVIFNYSLHFKNVVERGNTGAELSNSATFSGATTLGFGREKVLAVYDKENDVEQILGLPVLCRIPILKYLFSTATSMKERTYIIVTAEAQLAAPDQSGAIAPASVTTGIYRRIEDPFRLNSEYPAGKTEVKNGDKEKKQ